MRIFKQQFKRFLTFFLFTVIVSACAAAFAETVEVIDKEAHHVQKGTDWPGIYYGFLPCDDCKGVKTTLALNKNNSYLLITQYVGRSLKDIVEKGKFAAGEKSNTLILTPKNNTATHQYVVDENRLVQLDDNGNRISGKLADRYILRRTELTEPESSHSTH